MSKITAIVSCLAFGLFAFGARAADAITYLDESGNTCSVAAGACTLVTAATTELKDGRWYVVADPDVVSGGMTVSGSAQLILCDGMSLTVQGGRHQAGIAVPQGTSLSIYGQAAGTGVLRATGGASGAGIGGGDWGACGTVTINGGRGTAKGGDFAAGIGGGYAGLAISGPSSCLLSRMTVATGGSAPAFGTGSSKGSKMRSTCPPSTPSPDSAAEAWGVRARRGFGATRGPWDGHDLSGVCARTTRPAVCSARPWEPARPAKDASANEA